MQHSVLTPKLLGLVALLRRAGVKIGTGQVLAAATAIERVGVEDRATLEAALLATLTTRREDQPLFSQAFALLFKGRDAPNAALEGLVPGLRLPVMPGASLSRRLAEALIGDAAAEKLTDRVELDASLTASDTERLRHKDFEQMSIEEHAAALKLLATRLLIDRELKTRRWRHARLPGALDARAMLKDAAREGALIPRFRRRRTRPEALVLLIDVSGSMSRYARPFLQLAHALKQSHRRVSVYTFGTRLTPVTESLLAQDADQALSAVARAVPDWDGGTRIGEALKAFNRSYSRRVLAGGATVLLLTDGLERGDPKLLALEALRLKRSCRGLWWLNPLLRFRGYAPLAQGAKSLLPAVDRLLPAHDAASLAALLDALRTDRRESPRPPGESPRAYSSRTGRTSPRAR